jgi:AraC-like DNA-binding protein
MCTSSLYSGFGNDYYIKMWVNCWWLIIMKKSDILRQSFQDKLLSLVGDRAFDELVVLRDTVSIEALATLTKLVVRHRECIRGLQLEQPIMVVVLHGSKTIYLDHREYIFQAGELFLVPSAITIDIINQPNVKDNIYIALVLELSNNLLTRIRLAYPDLVKDIDHRQYEIQFKIPLTSGLVDSFVYLVESAINNATNNHVYLNEHHIMEVLLWLLNTEWRSQLLQIIYPDFLTQINNLLRRDLALPWTANKLAQELNMSVSTLKRKLKNYDRSFRQILIQARMNKAMQLLQQNQYTISEVALACGYESPSRFAARFRQYYRLNPSKINHLQK